MGDSGISGPSGPSGPNPANAGDVYIASAVDISGVTQNIKDAIGNNIYEFLRVFVSLLLTKDVTKTSPSDPTKVKDYEDPWPTQTGSNRYYPDAEISTHLSFSDIYTDASRVDPSDVRRTVYRLDNSESDDKRVVLRRGKGKKLGVANTVSLTFGKAMPFEIQIKSKEISIDLPTEYYFPSTRQVDFILFYLAKVGYTNDIERIKNAFRLAYQSNAWSGGPTLTDSEINTAIASISISFTPPVQIGVNDTNCGAYSIPGSDKRTAIAVLHDRVECILARIQDISGGGTTTVTTLIIPQYVAYNHGLDMTALPSTPVDWSTWYSIAKNNFNTTLGNNMLHKMPNPKQGIFNTWESTKTNLYNWVANGCVLVFASPPGSGTLSIFLDEFPFSFQKANNEPKDGAFIRLTNGNNPYPPNSDTTNPDDESYPYSDIVDGRNEKSGVSTYDDRFIFYDSEYRVLANITPGESVRVTWCASLPTPGWISIVGT